MQITLQYFDGCPNWTLAAERLAVIASERPDVTVAYRRVETAMEAEEIGFHGSPTMLLHGTDLFPVTSTAVGLACRVYVTPDGFAGSPTLDQLRMAIPMI